MLAAIDISASVTALGLAVAAVVADFQAIKRRFKGDAGLLFTALGAAFTGFTALYLDKVVIK